MKEDHANMPRMDHKTMKPEQGKTAAPSKEASSAAPAASKPEKPETPRTPGKS